jgi:epoxyqueuosine reductase
MQSLSEKFSLQIKEKALELGFAACGIAEAKCLENEREPLQKWLSDGMNGSMGYMANHFEKRLDPRKLVEGAKSVISVLFNYYPSQKQADQAAPVISKYAYGKDYHLTVKEKLNNLLIYIQAQISPCIGRAFVDSAPVLERQWAMAAGLGWTGKNTLLITRKFGSYVFIGELITNLDLACDAPFVNDHCGSCTRCIDACPTHAIVAPHRIDARKCISYQTIENKNEIPIEIQPKLQNQIFGCDICQDVCPWNNKLIPNQSIDIKPIDELLNMNKNDWAQLGKAGFGSKFKGSSFERTGYDRIMRNISYL